MADDGEDGPEDELWDAPPIRKRKNEAWPRMTSGGTVQGLAHVPGSMPARA